MKDDIFILPDLFAGSHPPETFFQFYTSKKPSFKKKIILKQNLVCFITQGFKEVFGTASSVKLNNRQVLLLQSGSVLMSETLSPDKNYGSILIFFSNRYVVDFCIRHKVNLSKESFASKNYSAIDKDDFLENYQASLTLLKNRHLPDLYALKLDELLLYLYHNYRSAFRSFLNETALDTPGTIIGQVMAIHAEDALTIDELAFLCNMSVSSFKRHFVSLYKTSPKKYFTGNRMSKAKRMLDLKKTPSEIYHELGYESLSSFSTEFKKYFGLSPRQLQKENERKAKVFEPLP